MKIGHASARGREGGQRQGMTKEAEKKTILAESYYKPGGMAVNKIALEIGISKITLYKYLRHRKVKIGSYIYQNDPKSQVIDIQ